MARIALSSFLHETSTFSPVATTRGTFERQKLHPAEVIQKFKGKRLNSALSGFFETAERLGHEVIPLVSFTEAEPSHTIPLDVFDWVMNQITDDLSEKGPFDGVFIDQHGAMVYGDFQDGEEEVVRRIRKVVGDIPIVSSIDTHGNINPESFDLISAFEGYRTYPHIDIYETGGRCARIMDHLVRKKPFYKAYRQLPFLKPVSRMPTTEEPSRSLFGMLDVLENDQQVISGTVQQGFNSADMHDLGPVVFAHGITQESADHAADQLYQAAMEREAEFVSDNPGPEDAVRMAIKLGEENEKPVILADGEDNPGGGSSSDTTAILEQLILQKAKGAALGLMYDPAAAEAAHKAGEGSIITVDLGGKMLAGHQPLHDRFEVVKLSEGDFVCTGPMMKGFTQSLGKMAQLRIDGVRIIVSSVRTQPLDQSYFRRVGIEPGEMNILVLKSSNHYRADFGPLSCEIINVSAPGGLIDDPSKAKYVNLRDGVRLCGLGPVQKKGS